MSVVIAVTAVNDFMRKVLSGTLTVAKSRSPKGVSTKIRVITPNMAATTIESFITVKDGATLHFNQDPVVRLLSLDLETVFTKAGTIALSLIHI